MEKSNNNQEKDHATTDRETALSEICEKILEDIVRLFVQKGGKELAELDALINKIHARFIQSAGVTYNRILNTEYHSETNKETSSKGSVSINCERTSQGLPFLKWNKSNPNKNDSITFILPYPIENPKLSLWCRFRGEVRELTGSEFLSNVEIISPTQIKFTCTLNLSSFSDEHRKFVSSDFNKKDKVGRGGQDPVFWFIRIKGAREEDTLFTPTFLIGSKQTFPQLTNTQDIMVDPKNGPIGLKSKQKSNTSTATTTTTTTTTSTTTSKNRSNNNSVSRQDYEEAAAFDDEEEEEDNSEDDYSPSVNILSRSDSGLGTRRRKRPRSENHHDSGLLTSTPLNPPDEKRRKIPSTSTTTTTTTNNSLTSSSGSTATTSSNNSKKNHVASPRRLSGDINQHHNNTNSNDVMAPPNSNQVFRTQHYLPISRINSAPTPPPALESPLSPHLQKSNSSTATNSQSNSNSPSPLTLFQQMSEQQIHAQQGQHLYPPMQGYSHPYQIHPSYYEMLHQQNPHFQQMQQQQQAHQQQLLHHNFIQQQNHSHPNQNSFSNHLAMRFSPREQHGNDSNSNHSAAQQSPPQSHGTSIPIQIQNQPSPINLLAFNPNPAYHQQQQNQPVQNQVANSNENYGTSVLTPHSLFKEQPHG